jgi:glutamyl/glutaminyl-tRNA synthetase
METYVTRLTHEKYASTYHKIATSLRNMFNAKPDSPTLLNFLALVRWTSPEAANKISADIGMHVAA